ncbi:hypothetical protein JMJ77_0008550 [Colletotrichum scovillei]|uniref:Ubiquitin-like domain-containing protein n=1 Tax=Colletotrichum scovillei TaxID=1209932 RepID=A0A9P7RH77_9PEZI|nr:hypothetical protein JMJ77_0008550 [Colletotrichum scovillei]KAG7075542.1 hypothetical protein JMJ76_0012002 [Colletotrichum scovillei]KAG7082592.1 hypothetical protein JMJ78_0004693 [Colletotrichum scovillei]
MSQEKIEFKCAIEGLADKAKEQKFDAARDADEMLQGFRGWVVTKYQLPGEVKLWHGKKELIAPNDKLRDLQIKPKDTIRVVYNTEKSAAAGGAGEGGSATAGQADGGIGGGGTGSASGVVGGDGLGGDVRGQGRGGDGKGGPANATKGRTARGGSGYGGSVTILDD